MTKVGNHYAIASTDPDVYHKHSDCSSGQNFHPQNRNPGALTAYRVAVKSRRRD